MAVCPLLHTRNGDTHGTVRINATPLSLCRKTPQNEGEKMLNQIYGGCLLLLGGGGGGFGELCFASCNYAFSRSTISCRAIKSFVICVWFFLFAYIICIALFMCKVQCMMPRCLVFCSIHHVCPLTFSSLPTGICVDHLHHKYQGRNQGRW